MIKTKSSTGIVFVLTVLILLISSCNIKPDLKNEERLIREFWDNASNYVCTGDWENYSRCWDHSSKIQIIHADQGEWLTGWEKIRVKYETLLGSGMKCSFPKNDLILNLSSTGDMAWGTADIILQFSDSTNTQIHLWETCVFEKIDGQWKMVMGMASVPNLK